MRKALIKVEPGGAPYPLPLHPPFIVLLWGIISPLASPPPPFHRPSPLVFSVAFQDGGHEVNFFSFADQPSQ